CIRPQGIRKRTILGIAAFTAFIGINFLLLCQQLPVVRDFYKAATSANLIGRTFGFVFGVGLLEEATKAIPLYWRYIHRQKPVNLRECAFLGCISGLAFGVAEGVLYLVLYALGREMGLMGYGDYLSVQFLRLITLPLLHALWAGSMGYFVGMAAQTPNKRNALLAVG